LNETPERIALAMRIGVQKDRDAAAHRSQTALKRARFPSVFLAQQTNPRIIRRQGFNRGGSPIL
jgi:hypothetical protein